MHAVTQCKHHPVFMKESSSRTDTLRERIVFEHAMVNTFWQLALFEWQSSTLYDKFALLMMHTSELMILNHQFINKKFCHQFINEKFWNFCFKFNIWIGSLTCVNASSKIGGIEINELWLHFLFFFFDSYFCLFVCFDNNYYNLWRCYSHLVIFHG